MAFNQTTSAPEYNNYFGKEKELANRIGNETLTRLAELRNNYSIQYTEISNKRSALKDNRRLKNKTLTFKEIADLQRLWFNYRSLDYFLYTMGREANCHATKFAGVEKELHDMSVDVQRVLMEYGQYKGFQDTYWFYAGGCKHWREDGSNELTKANYFREDLGIIYY